MIKLTRRKRMAPGSRPVRACTCDEYARDSLELRIPQLLRPARQLWPAARRRAPVRDPLFPGWKGKRALSDIRASAAGRNRSRGEKLGTHSLRGGAARAILGAGGSFSQLLRPGQWRSYAYQLYLDLGREEASTMASVHVEGSDDV